MTERIASVSVDLDAPRHYCRIHGLDEAELSPKAQRVLAKVAIPRLLELFDGKPATFFVVGEDVAEPEMTDALTSSIGAGVELASHGFQHDYAMSRWNAGAITADLGAADQALRGLGVVPRGFRAPGYTLSAALLAGVEALGYRYDASAFASVPYYIAKALIRATLVASGRPSRSVLDSPAVLTSPRTPYFPNPTAPYRRGHSTVLELPVAVAPISRLPFIGTYVTSAPWALVRATFATMRRLPFFGLELHAIDVLDATDGFPESLVRAQPDLRVPTREKMRRLREVIHRLEATYTLRTMADAAERLRVSAR